jgi:alpha-glucosidase
MTITNLSFWDDEARCAGFGEPFRVAHARPLQTLLMTRASYEAQKEYRPDKRPYLISRSGCPGIQRYAQTWSGDNQSNWETLKYNIPMGLGLSISGAPNTGHDVGGFCGNAPSPELFVRWVQNGVFHPRFTIHSYHADGSVNEPWMYPEVLPIIREWIEFRYRLIPYLYTLLFESTQTGHPIIRPMVYAFPGDPKCQTESFDFMLGPSLLVASVLQDGSALPPGVFAGRECVVRLVHRRVARRRRSDQRRCAVGADSTVRARRRPDPNGQSDAACGR